MRVTFRGLRKKAASQAGSASGPARTFRMRGWGARQELDDGRCALGARDVDDMGTCRCPCARVNGGLMILIVVPRDFLTLYHSPAIVVRRTLHFQLG
jgi:hypothetical protein